MEKINDIKIYKRYLEVKTGNGKVNDIFKEFGISRTSLYDAIRRVQNGNIAAMKRALKACYLECFWEYKYKPRFLALPNNQKPETLAEFRRIISEMKDDKFPVTEIAHRLQKVRSTILYHLSKIADY